MGRVRRLSYSKQRELEAMTSEPEAVLLQGRGGFDSGMNSRVVPLKKWRHKVAWAVALSVLLGVLLWVGGGGLDLSPSSSSAAPYAFDGAQEAGRGDDAVQGNGAVVVDVKTSGEPSDAHPAGDNDLLVTTWLTVLLRKSATVEGLTDEETDAAAQTAAKTVREALSKGGELPVPNPAAAFSQSCNVIVEGLPLYGTKQQRCCTLPSTKKKGDAGASKGGYKRDLEEDEKARENALPRVLQTQRTGSMDGKEVSCFPSFIIAGTQKSGTTALTGILEKHPQVRMAGRKELHFFDTKSVNPSTSGMYVKHFDSFNASLAMEHRAPFVVGEATPFYLASRKACMNMRKMIPDIKLIVLVREPVKRAYSEYQMKVRRVEEQKDMMRLLARDAKKVYDCAVQVLPSSLFNISEREAAMIRNPLEMAVAMGECAGEIGEHGKWTDTMFPFIKRLRGKLQVKTYKTSNLIPAIEAAREDFNRCFPLKDIAEQMELLYPGGKWKAQWDGSRERVRPGDRTGGNKIPRLPPAPLKGPPKRPKKMRGDQHHRDLLQAYQYYNEQSWLDIDVKGAAYGDFDSHLVKGDDDFPAWNTTEVPEVMPTRSLADGGDEWADSEIVPERYHGGDARARSGRGTRDTAARDTDDPALGEDTTRPQHDIWEGEERAALDGPPWAEFDALLRGDAADDPGDAWISSEVEAEWFEEHGGTGRRTLAVDKLAGFFGEWGQDGARIFDDTCYVRKEQVLPVENVMRREIETLKKCFKGALSGSGGLDAMLQMDAAEAAAKMDGKIDKCFMVTPGISDQFIYRSMYGVQAYHCLKHMPREQVLLIESDALRDRPEEILQEVHRHIGVPDFEYSSFGHDAIMEELEKKYPDFEKRTGWRLDSAYKEEMPKALAKDVGDFLKPHMTLFARLVGQSFGTWAVDDKDHKEAMAGGIEREGEMFEEAFHEEVKRIAAAKAARNNAQHDSITRVTDGSDHKGSPAAALPP